MNFESSQDRKEKNFVTFVERALKIFGAKQSGPSAMAGGGELLAGQIPAKEDHGSEGRVGEHKEDV